MGDLVLQWSIYYGCGALAYSVYLGITASSITFPRMFGILVWPIMVAHMVGSLINWIWEEI